VGWRWVCKARDRPGIERKQGTFRDEKILSLTRELWKRNMAWDKTIGLDAHLWCFPSHFPSPSPCLYRGKADMP
jgi:hypothetical protein